MDLTQPSSKPWIIRVNTIEHTPGQTKERQIQQRLSKNERYQRCKSNMTFENIPFSANF